MVRDYNEKAKTSKIRYDSPYDAAVGSLSDTELFMSPKGQMKQKVLNHPESRGAGFKDRSMRGRKISTKVDGEYQTSKDGTLQQFFSYDKSLQSKNFQIQKNTMKVLENEDN